MNAHRVRLGIIGTGLAARDLHWPALQQLSEQFEIVALCNHTRAKAEAFASLVGGSPRITSDYRELLSWPDVDAVDIALPIVMNASVAADALDAGKHVLLEKPIAHDLSSAHSVVAAAEDHASQVLLVAENVRYDERMRTARAILDSGAIGRPIMILAQVLSHLSPSSGYAQTSWRQSPQHLGGYLSDGGVHEVAALHMLAGRVVSAQGVITTFDPATDPTDTLLALLRFENGAVGQLAYSVGVPRGGDAPLHVYGTEGELAIHDQHYVLTTESNQEEIHVPPGPGSYYNEFLDFYRAVAEGKPPDVSPQDGYADLAVIDAVFRSSREATVITLS